MSEQVDSPASAATNRRPKRWQAWTCGLVLVALASLLLYGGAYLQLRDVHPRSERIEVDVATESETVQKLFWPAARLEAEWREFTREDARTILDQALHEANASGRKVWLAFGSSSCIPCKQLDQFLRQQRARLDRHFVFATIVTDQMRHARDVEGQYRNLDVDGGLYMPWCVVLDADGRSLVTSDGPNGAIALPQGSDQDRQWLLEMLRRTSSLTEDELNRLGS